MSNRLHLFKLALLALGTAVTLSTSLGLAQWGGRIEAQVAGSQPRPGNNGGRITLKSDVQEANSVTGVVTARGNVQINYPARQIYATSAQAQYFSNERRIILSGDVEVLQEGNRLQAETITYLIDEGRFVALPEPDEQVESIYLVPADASSTPAPATPEIPPPAAPPEALDISPLDLEGTP